MNPYFVAFCAATGATKDNFRPFEYMAWIGSKHKEFCEKTKMGKFCHEYHREFCKFLGGTAVSIKDIEKCTVIKKALKLGVGWPSINGDKCLGYAKSECDDEPLERCKVCKFLDC